MGPRPQESNDLPVSCHYHPPRLQRLLRQGTRKRGSAAAAMGVMDRLKIFVVKEPVVAASCLIAGFDPGFQMSCISGDA
ncbi:hypothetical protein PR202_gb01979 [Eleusine coracana subsp. coracana]|uniref:Uncharacterized protein n=1 Tax=Eleusine coracana subsp. coracana TaxID=191504 RepID=A0AAV5DVI7_ELECO|nr:hypothetical protein PR202_gb01979 [Eleusine coracana subsp. coracana]